MSFMSCTSAGTNGLRAETLPKSDQVTYAFFHGNNNYDPPYYMIQTTRVNILSIRIYTN